MEKLVIPSNINQINKINDYVDGYILNIDNLSTLSINTYNIDEIKNIKEKTNKKIFVRINKNILNSELDLLNDYINQLNNINIDGIMFYDLAILNNKDKINTNLIWDSEHATTNYLTINYYNKEGVTGTYISSDITKEDIIKIKNQTNQILFINIFGYLPIFNSYRPLINNYKKTFDLNSNNNYYLEKENKRYKIVEKPNNTFMYSDKIFSGLSYLSDFKDIDYIIFNSLDIDDDTFIKVLKNYQDNNYINHLFETSKYFLDNKTIYKVKR